MAASVRGACGFIGKRMSRAYDGVKLTHHANIQRVGRRISYASAHSGVRDLRFFQRAERIEFPSDIFRCPEFLVS
ncbi:hypothetical protein SDC9_212537 [bioreactor metagenome]|uniref:Uncharacterized protein n=1 Tax=bioreactor metagenome TaxID=1076179 RepID=A0A645JNU6_9ZZZZ